MYSLYQFWLTYLYYFIDHSLETVSRLLATIARMGHRPSRNVCCSFLQTSFVLVLLLSVAAENATQDFNLSGLEYDMIDVRSLFAYERDEQYKHNL